MLVQMTSTGPKINTAWVSSAWRKDDKLFLYTMVGGQEIRWSEWPIVSLTNEAWEALGYGTRP